MFLCFLPSLFGQTGALGFVPVPVGALKCGVVMRSASTVQAYCSSPANCNSLKGVNAENMDVCLFCVPAVAGVCTPTVLVWFFKIVPTGISYEATLPSGSIASGTLTKVYGSP